jgi:methyl-accepting chemotaxis protein
MSKVAHSRNNSPKLLLILASFALPLAVLTGVLVKEVNRQIEFVSLEMAGNSYQRAMEQLLEAAQEHWLAQTETAASRVDHAFESLGAVQRRLGTELQVTREELYRKGSPGSVPDVLASKWTQARVQDAGAQQMEMLTDFRQLIAHVGDTSNLILDPDLDSYYLMDVTLLALPDMQTRIGQILVECRSTLNRQTVSPEERIAIAVDLAYLREAGLARVVASSKKSMNQADRFRPTIPAISIRLVPALADLRTDTEQFLAVADRFAKGDETLGRAELEDAGIRALEQNYIYWHVASQQLDILLADRLRRHESVRQRSLFGAGLAILAATLFSGFMLRNIPRADAAIAPPVC